jgi:hypothetical protein
MGQSQTSFVIRGSAYLLRENAEALVYFHSQSGRDDGGTGRARLPQQFGELALS